jgi:hypothetical protein
MAPADPSRDRTSVDRPQAAENCQHMSKDRPMVRLSCSTGELLSLPQIQ